MHPAVSVVPCRGFVATFVPVIRSRRVTVVRVEAGQWTFPQYLRD